VGTAPPAHSDALERQRRSGTSASSVRAVTSPTPGTLFRKFCFSFQDLATAQRFVNAFVESVQFFRECQDQARHALLHRPAQRMLLSLPLRHKHLNDLAPPCHRFADAARRDGERRRAVYRGLSGERVSDALRKAQFQRLEHSRRASSWVQGRLIKLVEA
jgi:hypothetical protein